MKKRTKIALGVVAAVIIIPSVTLAVWWPTSPQKVCEKEVQLLEQSYKDQVGGEIPEDMKAEFNVDSCVTDTESARMMQGLIKYKKFSSCVMKAQKAEDVDSCEG